MSLRQVEFAKKLRRNIYGYSLCGLGITAEELHIFMDDLGYGDSLKKLNLSQLICLNNHTPACF